MADNIRGTFFDSQQDAGGVFLGEAAGDTTLPDHPLQAIEESLLGHEFGVDFLGGTSEHTLHGSKAAGPRLQK
jgi:hypothetical protein